MIKKKIIGLSIASMIALSFVGTAHARFFDVMSYRELTQEIRLWLKSGMSLEVIAKSALQSGVSADRLATNMIENGHDAATVVTTLINVEPKSASVITAAALRVAPKQRDAIYAAALTATGLDPSITLPATAVGEDSPDRR